MRADFGPLDACSWAATILDRFLNASLSRTRQQQYIRLGRVQRQEARPFRLVEV